MLKKYLEQSAKPTIDCDSAGIYALVDAPAEATMSQMADNLGFSLLGHRARQIEASDYRRFDYLIALDLGHYDYLCATKPSHLTPTISPLLSYAPDAGTLEVPDPYRKSRRVFERCAKLIDKGVRGLLRELWGENWDYLSR